MNFKMKAWRNDRGVWQTIITLYEKNGDKKCISIICLINRQDV